MIPSTAFERLRAIGLAPAVIEQIESTEPPADDSCLMRVTEVQREHLCLHDGSVERSARQLPALRLQLSSQADALAVGDWVWAQPNALGEWWVHTRLPPLTQLARRLHDGRDKVTRAVIVSNVDTALLVMGLDHDFSLRRLERYVALVRLAGVAAVVVLTKRDIGSHVAARMQQVAALLRGAVPAVAVNALGDEPSVALQPWLQPGRTLVLLGSSGAGKSTLTNVLCGARQDTGATRGADGRGRHTTTARSLHVTTQGACIIDTPGLRTLRLDGDADELGAVFDDIAEAAARCRFRDCSHGDEPGCAVRAAVAPERLANYGKLLREARRDSMGALERKAQLQQWKVRSRNARARSEDKRG